MVTPRKGTRVPAADVCRRNGWGPGTMLTSARWKAPRELYEIDGVAIVLKSGKVVCPSVDTLPADVREVACG